MANGETVTPVEQLDRRHQALLRLEKRLPELEQDAAESQSRRVIDGVDHVRRAVQSKRFEYEHPRVLSPRDAALMQWAPGRYLGDSPYAVQGGMIHSGVQWMSEAAVQLLQESPSSSLNLDVVKTAGYRAVKACACNFDPSHHGEDFHSFALPFVIAAMKYCLEVGNQVLPNTTQMDFLQSLIDRKSVTEAVEPAATTPVASVAVAEPSAHHGSAGNGTRIPRAEAVRPKPFRTPLPSAPAMSPEQEAECKRRRRFCRWAKDGYQIAVTQDQFEQAVQEISEKHHPLANGVVDKMGTLNTFRGGKSAVRREAKRLLPERVRDFDPAGGEHFNQFLTVWLEPKLREFVAGNGKKRREA